MCDKHALREIPPYPTDSTKKAFDDFEAEQRRLDSDYMKLLEQYAR